MYAGRGSPAGVLVTIVFGPVFGGYAFRSASARAWVGKTRKPTIAALFPITTAPTACCFFESRLSVFAFGVEPLRADGSDPAGGFWSSA